jgi:hypothetical protein
VWFSAKGSPNSDRKRCESKIKMGSPENSKQDGGNKGSINQDSGNHHDQNPSTGFFSSDILEIGAAFILFVFSGVFHVAGGWFHIIGFICDFLIIWCGLTIISHHAGERTFKLFGLRYWVSLGVAFSIIAVLIVFVVGKEETESKSPFTVQSNPDFSRLKSGATNIPLQFAPQVTPAEIKEAVTEALEVSSIPHFTNVFVTKTNFVTQTNEPVAKKWEPPELPKDQNFFTIIAGGRNVEPIPKDGDVIRVLATAYKDTNGNWAPLTIIGGHITKNRFYADVTIPGDFPLYGSFKLSGNTIEGYLPPGWQMNYDAYAIEIINYEKNPVYQIIYRKPEEIEIDGVFWAGNKVFAVTGDGIDFMPPPPLAEDWLENAAANLQLRRIFKYPATSYLGQRVVYNE